MPGATEILRVRTVPLGGDGRECFPGTPAPSRGDHRHHALATGPSAHLPELWAGGSRPRFPSSPLAASHAMQRKTLLAADMTHVDCSKCGDKQARVISAEDSFHFTELHEALAIQAFKAVGGTFQVPLVRGGEDRVRCRRGRNSSGAGEGDSSSKGCPSRAYQEARTQAETQRTSAGCNRSVPCVWKKLAAISAKGEKQ